ncbi:potassium voltage-gated channel subfamily G member 2 [Astyanax mexicanus]|uniref:Potassium voltage-gated channel modifier subfamily G member 2 n=1 Tax=Astyanax mexicanus TaxID=7994 RepID=A0A8B9KYN5_ASTMX|nr:potassium voltage-gated channel subfamily G member 2 [Astyanax mexicanus]
MYQEVAFLAGNTDHQFTTFHFNPLKSPVETGAKKGIFYKRARQLPWPSEFQEEIWCQTAIAHDTLSIDSNAIINVGGIRYSIPWSTLEEFPLTRLGKLRSCSSAEEIMDLCDDYDACCNEFFFDRSPNAFRCIVTFLAAGKLRLLREMCALSFQEELMYWGVKEASLEWCCLKKLRLRQEDQREHLQQEEEETEPVSPQPCEEVSEGQDKGYLTRCMNSLRDMVENPHSGLPGKIFASLSVVFVAITAVTLCVSTMPDLREEEERGECSQRCYNIFVLETVCVGWFSLEFLLRFIQTQRKCLFLSTPLNIIDVVAILPYYITLIVDSLSVGDQSTVSGNNYLEKVGLVLRVLRALRICYVMRLARHSVGLQTLGLTIRRCTREFGLLLLFLCVAMALFSPLVFLAESEMGAKQEFTSIPGSYWWAVISMTTVGYGDMVPRSIPGQVVALSSILSGILLMAFPVTSIFHTFSRSYLELKEQQNQTTNHKAHSQDSTKSQNSEDSQETDSSLHGIAENMAATTSEQHCRSAPMVK